MNLLIIGASTGLGRAFVEGLAADGDTIFGVSRCQPATLQLQSYAQVGWINADMSDPVSASDTIEELAPSALDVIIYNLGIWEADAFSESYSFLTSQDEEIVRLVDVNITAPILLLKRLIPRLLQSDRPQIVLTGSTSGLRQSGRPEVAFGASKFALRGIADALRENFRKDRLAISCLQLGDLNTEDPLSVNVDVASKRGHGSLIPLHDVVALTKTLLSLSNSSYVNELILPPILDTEF